MLSGKHYWLIGASTGIGKELAVQLAGRGVRLILSARNESALLALANDLAKPQGTAAGTGEDPHSVLPLDVRDGKAVEAACAAVGAIDGMIYCAGVYEPMTAREPDLPSLEAIADVNFVGAMRVLAGIVPVFCASRAGHILLVGSLAGYRGLPHSWGYGASKAALINLAEALRCDLAGTGIKTQIVNPGFVATRLTAKNAFRMPAIMTANAAAARIVRGMVSGRFEIAYPPGMAVAFKVLAALPHRVYFALLALAASRTAGSS